MFNTLPEMFLTCQTLKDPNQQSPFPHIFFNASRKGKILHLTSLSLNLFGGMLPIHLNDWSRDLLPRMPFYLTSPIQGVSTLLSMAFPGHYSPTTHTGMAVTISSSSFSQPAGLQTNLSYSI